MVVTDPTLNVEHSLFAAGFTHIIAVDEVGRGALAGPVAVGAVLLDAANVTAFPTGLRDSKLLSERVRERLVPECETWVNAYAVGLASAHEIDEHGIMWALGAAAQRAFSQLEFVRDTNVRAIILLDGNTDYLNRGNDESTLITDASHSRPRVVTRVQADRDCASVAAASVLAKVRRDTLMVAEDQRYPQYGWCRNKGYGTAEHRAAIMSFGPTPMHRTTWLTGLDIIGTNSA